MHLPDSFSPYLDPEPIADFFDDFASRHTTAIAFALVVHIGLFFTLQSNFIAPILPPEPEPIEVQIISFEPTSPVEPEPQPVLRPAVPSPAQAPTPKPKPRPTPPPPPKPEPEPEIIPEPIPEPIIEPEPRIEPIPEPIPEPVVEPEPEPIPEPITELLSTETLEPEPETIVQPEPIIESEPIVDPIPDPLPEPIIETEPLPEPVIELTEPTPEPESEPTIEIFEPVPESIIEPEPTIEIFETQLAPVADPTSDPILEPLPEPLPEILPEPEPEVEPIPDLPLAPTISEEPISGAVTENIITETPEPIIPLVQEEPLEPQINEEPIITPDPNPTPEPEPEPEIIKPETPIIITTAPTILASPEAPTTQIEEQNAVPQSQATPLDLILQTPNSSGGGTPPSIPRGGGNAGNIPIGAPPNGGTARANPGANGWTLAPGSYGEGTGAGYKGLKLDIECRERTRTHEDCPEYIPKNKGRNADGFEGFSNHVPRGTTTVQASRGANYGTSTIFGSRGSHSAQTGAQRTGGPLDDNTGLPSTSVLDDVNGFNGQYAGDSFGGASGGRVRDAFGNTKPAPWTLQPDLPTPTEEDEEDEIKSLIIKPKPVDSGG